MNRLHPTITGPDTQTTLMQLLQSILSFALIDKTPGTGKAAITAVGHIATKAAEPKPPCIHFRSTFDEEGSSVCYDCGVPL